MTRVNYIDIDWPDLFKPIPGLKQSEFNRIRINREVIPIIFVPGIMGSRLKNKRTGESVWDPDREIMCMLRKYGGAWNTPAQRKRMLIGRSFRPDYLEVDELNARHNRKVNTFLDPTRADRGWGGVYWGSYGRFLEQLQRQKWDQPLKYKEDRGKEVVGKCFEFPIHAFGYNWTDSNYNSGGSLAVRIARIKAFYKAKNRLCKYVILISHSMGGLVCRSACIIHPAGKDVLGVIHGMQPATGAPAAYWRMKAGFERVGNSPLSRLSSKAAAWVLGTNGEEVTCILGNAPGGLELLPNQYYTDNNGQDGWLHVPGIHHEYALPRHHDPYDEIYTVKDKFWRLITPAWLDPRDKLSPPINSSKHHVATWSNFTECIKTVRFFHDKLQTNSHSNTYQFFSGDLNTVDKIAFNREDLKFVNLEMPSDFGFPAVLKTNEPCRKSTSSGNCTMYVDDHEHEVTPSLQGHSANNIVNMAHPDIYRGGGDGTVPVSSGNALKQVLHSKQVNFVEHQEAFNDANAVDYVFRAVINLALKRIKEGEVTSAR